MILLTCVIVAFRSVVQNHRAHLIVQSGDFIVFVHRIALRPYLQSFQQEPLW